jgi:hypothetical protein
VSVDVAEALRAAAKREGVSFNTFLQRVLSQAVSPADPIIDGVWYDGYTPFT